MGSPLGLRIRTASNTTGWPVETGRRLLNRTRWGLIIYNCGRGRPHERRREELADISIFSKIVDVFLCIMPNS